MGFRRGWTILGESAVGKGLRGYRASGSAPGVSRASAHGGAGALPRASPASAPGRCWERAAGAPREGRPCVWRSRSRGPELPAAACAPRHGAAVLRSRAEPRPDDVLSGSRAFGDPVTYAGTSASWRFTGLAWPGGRSSPS